MGAHTPAGRLGSCATGPKSFQSPIAVRLQRPWNRIVQIDSEASNQLMVMETFRKVRLRSKGRAKQDYNAHLEVDAS